MLSLLVVAVAGCGGIARRGASAQDEADTIAVAPIAMQGQSSFFGGTVAARVTVSRGFGEEMSQRLQRRIDEEGPKLAEVFEEELADRVKNPIGETLTRMSALIPRGSPIPPVIIRLILTNPGAEPVEVEIVEFNSVLGNFAIRPSNLTLAPGGGDEPEAMSSRLGVTSDNIPVTVVLRVNGVTERQAVNVRTLLPAAGPQ